MSDIAIKVEHLGKLYRLGEISTGTISHDLNRWFAKRMGKEDPSIKIGTQKKLLKPNQPDYTWALKDISFEIKKGEAVGIIGRNGAGKSTLLKLLSKITKPTTGQIKLNGRIASLLEVGTGFHPEMTGRENIFLNGAILGMRKHEIKRQFDAIVDFSGVGRYIDTPVKRYSSGMYVRLAFAVAAHLESEILIVDEVLAVGDIEFQKKCLGKMDEVSKADGRTVLFVSHNMASIKALCGTGILLDKGQCLLHAGVNKVVDTYFANNIDTGLGSRYFRPVNSFFLENLEIRSAKLTNVLESGELIELAFAFKNYAPHLLIEVGIYHISGEKIFNLSTAYLSANTNKSEIFCIFKNNLVEGNYYCNLLITDQVYREHYSQCLQFNVLNGDFYEQGRVVEAALAKVFIEHEWK